MRGGSDEAIRPQLDLAQLLVRENSCLDVVRALGRIYHEEKALALGDYEQLLLTTRQYAFRRGDVIVAVNNDGEEAILSIPCKGAVYQGALHGKRIQVENGHLTLRLGPCDGEILIPENRGSTWYEPIRTEIQNPPQQKNKPAPPTTPGALTEKDRSVDLSKPYDQMSVSELQMAILQKLAANGPVTEQMHRDVEANVWRDSLLNWIRSFR